MKGKIVIVCITGIILTGVLTELIFFKYQEMIIDTVGKNYQGRTEILSHGIDTRIQDVFDKAEMLFSQEKVSDYLKASNEEFSNFSDPLKFITATDEEWVSHNTDESFPPIRKILNNSLSLHLKKFSEKSFLIKDDMAIKEIILTNSYGANVALTNISTDYKQDDEEWWQKAKENGMYVSSINYDQSVQRFTVDFGLKITDSKGNFLGIAKIVFDNKLLLDPFNIIGSVEKYRTTKYLIITNNGSTVYSNEFEPLQNLSQEKFFPLLKSSSGHFITKINNDEKIFSYSKLKNHDLDWIVIIYHDKSEITQPTSDVLYQLFMVIFLSFFIVYGISYYFFKEDIKQVLKIGEALLKVSNGNYNTKIDLGKNKTLKTISNAFNSMTDALKESEKQIQTQFNKIQLQNKELLEIDNIKNQFGNVVAHELQTPLIPIKGYCEMLLDEKSFGVLSEDQRRSLQIIYNETVHLEKLVQDVLTLQRLEMNIIQPNKTQVHLNSLFNFIKKKYSDVCSKKNIQISISNPNDEIVFTDSHLIEYTLEKLLDNATVFTKQNSTVNVGYTSNKKEIIFYVFDEGVGISQEQQKNLFKKYYQLDMSRERKHDGLGIGLTIVKEIVNVLGGKIWYTSEVDKGSKFYFTIPKT